MGGRGFGNPVRARAAALACILVAVAAVPLGASGTAVPRVLYFAYGSNMNQADLDRWCDAHGRPRVRPRHVTVAVLAGYALSFDYFSETRNSGAADVVQSPGGQVYGLLMEISAEDRETIRAKEGWPDHYEELTVAVATVAGANVRGVTTYRVIPSLRLPEPVAPSRAYLDLIVSSARRHRFPKAYIEELERIPTE
jgi:hypothetical protein